MTLQGSRYRTRLRLVVHLLLILTAAVSLALEPIIALHVALGLAFVALVGAHLAQRRRTSVALLKRLKRPSALHRRGGRLLLSDLLLLTLTAGMLVSGLWDWSAGHPTRIRWHALTGVVLAGYLAGHTVRRRRRLRASTVT